MKASGSCAWYLGYSLKKAEKKISFCTKQKDLSGIFRSHIPDERIYGKAHHEIMELIRRHPAELFGGSGPGETTFFDTLIEKEKTIAFPKKPLDLSGGMTTEEKERIWHEKADFIALLNDGG